MKNLLLSICAAFALLLPAAAFADCASGTLAAGAACHSGTCNSGSGFNFTGQCIAGASSSTTLPATPAGFPSLVRCGSSASVCASGPFGTTTSSGCLSDGQCASGQVCVSSAGSAGCGTAYSVCMTTCSG